MKSIFQVGQKVTWKPEVCKNPGWNEKTKKQDDMDMSLVPIMGSKMPAIITKIHGNDVFLDIPGHQHVPCNAESLMLIE